MTLAEQVALTEQALAELTVDRQLPSAKRDFDEAYRPIKEFAFEELAGEVFPSLVARLREAESLLAETAGKVGSFGPIMFESERELVARLTEFLKGRLSP